MNLSHIPRILRAPDGGGAGGGSGGGAGGGDPGAGGGAGAGTIDFRTFIDQAGAFVKPDWAGEEKDAAAKFKSLPDLWKSYRTLERINSSGNKVAVPTDASTPEEWDAFYSKLGRPESADKYEFTVPDDAKEVATEEAMKEFRATAFKNGLNGKQVKALTDYYFKSVKSATDLVQQQSQQRIEASERDLEKEWGPKGGAKWKENLALADRGAALVGLTPQILQATPELANNPHFIRAMAKVAMTTKEGGTPNPGSGGGGGFGGDVRAQIKAIMDDAKHPYWIKDHPGHAAAVEQMAALHARAAGSS